MVAQAPEPQRPNATQPEVASPPRILVVDNDYLKMRDAREMLGRCGYSVEVARDPQQAIPLLKNTRFDLVIVDGDLGDSKWGDDGISAKFIREHLQGTTYGRFSNAVSAIPETLHGAFAVEDIRGIQAWLSTNLPITDLASAHVARNNHTERPAAMAEQPRNVGRSFPDLASFEDDCGLQS
jgi:ActR/RegA family two-component response regulator